MSAAKDFTGKKIGMLKVMDRKRENNKTYYYCVCDCGNERWFRAETLNSNTPSCGCISKFKPSDISGKRFGRLVACEPLDKRAFNGSIIWLCKCDCGNYVELSTTELTRGRSVSCGCYQQECRKRNIQKAVDKHLNEKIVEGTNLGMITRTKPLSSNTSGVTGVRYDETRSKWIAQIEFKGKRYYLGRYEEKQDAINIRKEAEEQLFGTFLKWYQEQKTERHK